ncbi:helix-turn-helix domain-containing protein [Alphaproteobacteria bacterium LSUCC0684]
MMKDQATKDPAIQRTSEEVLAIVGAELAAARRERGLKLADIAERLRILPDHIAAIEQGNLAPLPQMTYVIGYVRSYANMVGADAASLCHMLRDSLTENEINPKYEFVQNNIRTNSNAGLVAVAALGACFFLYAGWYVMDLGSSPSATGTEEVLATMEGADDTLPATLMPEFEERDAGVPAGDTLVEAGQGASPEPASGLETSANTADTGLQTETPAPVMPAENAAATLPSATADTPGPEEPGAVAQTATQAMAVGRLPDQDMTIHAVATSWVEITRADGSRVSAWLMQKDDKYTIPGGDDLYLTTGNAGGLEIILGQDEKFVLGEWGETVKELPLDKSLIKTRP